ncbi:MAG: hypothetical protein HYZ29_27915 [Myxococcales bacterium]|nr:hypothetical protein [Myxococcales bacterium]
MTDPINSTRRRNDYEDMNGGYCAADGTVQYSAGPGPVPAAPKRPVSTHREAPALKPSAQKLVDDYRKKPGLERGAWHEKKLGRTELSVGVASQGTGAATDSRGSLVDATVPLSKTVDAKASLGATKISAGMSSDGSVGFGVSASVASVELAYSSGSDSMSIGVDVGLSAGLSVGARDANGNGIPETCWSADLGVSIAACTEDAAPPQADGPRGGASGTGGREAAGGSGGASGW